MTIDVAREKARESGLPSGAGRAGGRAGPAGVWPVVFCGPHEEYLESEPERFFPLEIHYPSRSIAEQGRATIGRSEPPAP